MMSSTVVTTSIVFSLWGMRARPSGMVSVSVSHLELFF
jgi:hypothetical protein